MSNSLKSISYRMDFQEMGKKDQEDLQGLFFTFWIIFSGDLVRDPTRWFHYLVPGLYVLILLFFAVNYFKTAQRIKELEQTGLPVEKDALG